MRKNSGNEVLDAGICAYLRFLVAALRGLGCQLAQMWMVQGATI